MSEADEHRTRGVSPRGVVTASPFAIATQRGRCGYGGEPCSIPLRQYQMFKPFAGAEAAYDIEPV